MRRPRGTAPTRVVALAAAKVNIGWRVGRVRDDGYHEVQGCLHTIDLHDTITFDTSGEVGFTVDGDEAQPIEDNLIVRAAEVMAEHATPRATKIHLTKRIPIAAGLGGGSSNAAATLVALSLLWGARLTARDLLEIGATLGSDVPALIAGGLVHCEGRGEDVRNIGAADQSWFVLGVADGGTSTKRIYERFDAIGPQTPATLWHNDLEVPAIDARPELRSGLDALTDAGAVAAWVSGSGPTCVGAAIDETHARSIAAGAAPAFRRTIVTRATTWGVRLQLG